MEQLETAILADVVMGNHDSYSDSSSRTGVASIGCPHTGGAFPFLDDLVQHSVLFVHAFSGAGSFPALVNFACFSFLRLTRNHGRGNSA